MLALIRVYESMQVIIRRFEMLLQIHMLLLDVLGCPFLVSRLAAPVIHKKRFIFMKDNNEIFSTHNCKVNRSPMVLTCSLFV